MSVGADMSGRLILVYAFGLLLTLSAGQDPPVCTDQKGPCACNTKDGWINLEPLDSKDGSNPKFQGIADFNGDSYSYNPCSDFTFGGCDNQAVCQSRDSLGYPLGNQNSAKFGNDPTYGDLTLSYSATGNDGVNRIGIVTLKCDPSQEGTLDAQGEYPTGTYDLTLTSKYACPGQPPPSGGGGGGLSGGSILLIICVTLMFVYVLSFVLFNKFAKGAEGKEVLPHVNFWSSLPGLAKDGAMFTYGRIRGLCGGGGSTSRSGYDEF